MGTLFIVVGSSKGFGRSLVKACLQYAKSMGYGSYAFLLLTSCQEGCMGTWNEIYHEVTGNIFENSKEIQLFIEKVDMEARDCFPDYSIILSKIKFSIKNYFIFFNAGSVTPVGPMLSESAGFETQLRDHCNLNFVSFVTNIRMVLRVVLEQHLDDDLTSIRVANISSLAAVKCLHGMSVYGAIKAARESIVVGLAHEFVRVYPKMNVKLLNYSPGPMKTDLVLNHLTSDLSASNFVKENQTVFVECDKSAQKCLSLLAEFSYKWKSGDRIDYYDDVE